MAKYNKLDEPLKDIYALANETPWDIYDLAKNFSYICTIEPDRKTEKLSIIKEINIDMHKSCVYVMVIEGKIFKIGVALRGIRGRIGSYNSGKIKYRVKGTNSGSNYWVLQSLINMGVQCNFYGLYPPLKPCVILGIEVEEPFPSAKTMEGIVIRKFEEKYDRKPIGCTQG